ncbi:MAG: MFS transporter, partial [Actinobacteria bacterium]|nr:MFS transporter [Actinomycetota bacterium]
MNSPAEPVRKMSSPSEAHRAASTVRNRLRSNRRVLMKSPSGDKVSGDRDVRYGLSPNGAARPVGGGPAHAAGVVTQRAAAGWGLPLGVLVVGTFMSILDISIVNVAIPTIQNDFGATTDEVQWVITGYALTEGVVVPATAWLGDRLGLSRVYNVAMLAFAAGSALCGLAWDLNSLVIFRVVQAIPGGILPVVTLSILYR